MNFEFTLWMGDIQPWMTQIFILNSFHHFGFYPKNIKIIHDKKSNLPLNYCFINFDSLNIANTALNRLNGVKIPNAHLESRFRLNWANKNFENFKNVYVGNISPHIKDVELFNIFKQRYPSVLYANIVRENKGKKNYGFVYFAKDEEYKKCLNEMNGFILGNSSIKVKQRIKKGLDGENNINNNNISINKVNNNIRNNISSSNINVNKIEINIRNIKSFYPKKKEKENSQMETNSSSEEESLNSKRKFSDNLDILESNDHSLINKNIQKCVNKMFNYYKNNNDMSGILLYYSSNHNEAKDK